MTKWLLLGVAFAAFLFVYTYTDGGLDGPCVGSDWARSLPERTGTQAERSWWPPGVRCTATGADGSVVATRMWPPWWVWAAALLPVCVALGRWWGRRRRPRAHH